MARQISEQAIAEVRIDDQQAADRLEKLTTRSKELREELLNVGDSLSKKKGLEKELKIIDKEIKTVFNQSVNVKKILEDINGTSFNKLQQAQQSLTRQFKAGSISAKEYQQQITPINRRMQELQNTMRSGISQQKSFEI